MEARRIAILTGNPLHSNPRVIKEASALTEAGFEVIVHGAWSGEGGGGRRKTGDRTQEAGGGDMRHTAYGAQHTAGGGRLETEVGGVETDMLLAERGGYAFVPLLPPHTRAGMLHRLVQRAARKVLPWSKWTFGLMPLVLEREALRLRPHLAIAHSEPALFAALSLHRRGVKVGVDMEDWFSEDLSAEARRSRPVALLRRAEQKLLCCASHATCTTEVMADALAHEYGCPRPTRIYNVFPQPFLSNPVELRDRSPNSKSLEGTPSQGSLVRSIHWFSQTLGPGRGLEDLFAAAAGIEGNIEIHLRGNRGGYASWLETAVPEALRSRVFIHGLVSNEELPQRIAEHDIGFAGETTSIPSRDLTATNKIFQYLQSGLAVLASDTAGQQEVEAKSRGAVRLFRGDDERSLQDRLSDLLAHHAAVQEMKKCAQDAATDLCWAREKQRLLHLVRTTDFEVAQP